MVSVYFHIPFCSKKCPYCHFYVIPNKLSFHELLLEGLHLEWQQQQPLLQGKQITSVYFGGGTPTLFGAKNIGTILSWCNVISPCEITVEANPEEATLELFSELKAVGVNRLSLGVQSLDDRALATLERTHNAERAKAALQAAHTAGIHNVSIDLMYDLPGQTLSSWQYTLDQLVDLPFTHLSLYNLTIEPHTSFSKRKLQLPAPETSVQFLHMALDRFQRLGLQRYEISAFCRPGFRSKHNLGYWQFRPFLGFGPSAFSYWGGERFQNVPNLQRYVRHLRAGQSAVSFREKLGVEESRRERLAVGLRCADGCSVEGVSSETRVVLEKLVREGLVVEKRDRVQLTEKGMLFYDTVASEIV